MIRNFSDGNKQETLSHMRSIEDGSGVLSKTGYGTGNTWYWRLGLDGYYNQAVAYCSTVKDTNDNYARQAQNAFEQAANQDVIRLAQTNALLDDIRNKISSLQILEEYINPKTAIYILNPDIKGFMDNLEKELSENGYIDACCDTASGILMLFESMNSELEKHAAKQIGGAKNMGPDDWGKYQQMDDLTSGAGFTVGALAYLHGLYKTLTDPESYGKNTGWTMAHITADTANQYGSFMNLIYGITAGKDGRKVIQNGWVSSNTSRFLNGIYKGASLIDFFANGVYTMESGKNTLELFMDPGSSRYERAYGVLDTGSCTLNWGESFTTLAYGWGGVSVCNADGVITYGLNPANAQIIKNGGALFSLAKGSVTGIEYGLKAYERTTADGVLSGGDIGEIIFDGTIHAFPHLLIGGLKTKFPTVGKVVDGLYTMIGGDKVIDAASEGIKNWARTDCVNFALNHRVSEGYIEAMHQTEFAKTFNDPDANILSRIGAGTVIGGGMLIALAGDLNTPDIHNYYVKPDSYSDLSANSADLKFQTNFYNSQSGR